MLMIPAEKNTFKLHPIKLPSASTASRLDGIASAIAIGAATAQSRKPEQKKSCGTAPRRAPSLITCTKNMSH
jgi:hypothetical protein